MRTKLVILFFILLGISVTYFFGHSLLAYADTNINATTSEHFAWNPAIGWIDFYAPMTVTVKNAKIEGYASSSFGEISLDCATSPNGNICSQSNYGVCNGANGTRDSSGVCIYADATGDLSGYAWNDKIGWISMRGTTTLSSYGVSIANGIFSGYAWNDVVGWISFNGIDYSSSINYKVATSWIRSASVGYLESSIYDTQKTNGVLLNNIVWNGEEPEGGGGCVGFQIAASNSPTGPWIYKGPSSETNEYYGASCSNSAPNGGGGCADPGKPICVKKTDFSNYRYFRYKVRVQTNLMQKSPEIHDIILNWSP